MFTRIKTSLAALAIGFSLTLGTAGLAWSQSACTSGIEATVPEAVMHLHEIYPNDQIYVLQGNEFKEFIRAVGALAGKPVPETALAQVDTAIITNGPGKNDGETDGAGIMLFKGQCLYGHIVVTSQNFLDALSATAPNATPVPDLSALPLAPEGSSERHPTFGVTIPGARVA